MCSMCLCVSKKVKQGIATHRFFFFKSKNYVKPCGYVFGNKIIR